MPPADRAPRPPQPGIGARELRGLYRAPHELVLRKQQDRVDEHSAAFVEAATLVVLATSGPAGTDASPRGGPPGFVRVLDERRLAFADLAGNNRLDSYGNLAEHPEVGLLFVVPGLEETLRVNGRAVVTTDPDVLDATVVDGIRPRTAVLVEVAECFVHCGKALRRARVWEPGTWPGSTERPSPGDALVAHLALDATGPEVAEDLEVGYRATLWEAGGRASRASGSRRSRGGPGR